MKAATFHGAADAKSTVMLQYGTVANSGTVETGSDPDPACITDNSKILQKTITFFMTKNSTFLFRCTSRAAMP
jgi:hypothetical protein